MQYCLKMKEFEPISQKQIGGPDKFVPQYMKLFDQARHSTWSIYKCNHEVVIFCYYPWKIFSCDLSSVNCQHFFFFWWVNIYFCDTPMQIFSNVSKLIFLSFSSENQDEDSFVKNIVRCLMWLGVENYPV